MNINGYNIALSEEDLEFRLSKQSIDIKLVDENFVGYINLKKGDKKALEYLIEAASVVNSISLKQDHHMNMVQRDKLIEAAAESNHAALALRLFDSFNGLVAHNGIDKEPVQIFEEIHGYVGKNFYPIDLSEKEFHNILLKMLEENKNEEVSKILSPRTIVIRKSDDLAAVDYNEYFSAYVQKIAKNLEAAAKHVTNKDFAQYLTLQAIALQGTDDELDMKADMKWAELQNTELEFTLSRESYDDMMTPSIYNNKKLVDFLEERNIEANAKDMLGIRVGIVNKEGTDLILKFKDGMLEIAKLMPHRDSYVQNFLMSDEIKQTMVDVDLVSLKGDYAQCRGGITTAQNLPNNDKLAVKKGGGRRNVYHRQVRISKDQERAKKILNKFVSSDLHQYYDDEADHLFVIGHENGHSFGPNSSYQESLAEYCFTIEEAKSDFVSLAFMDEYVRLGVIDEETLKKVYLTNTVGRLFLSAEPSIEHPHRVAELIQFNYMLEKKLIWFEDEKLNIDFSKYSKILRELLSETIELQLSKSPSVAEKFIKKYSHWGKHSREIESFMREIGVKPYKIIHEYFKK